MFWLFSTQEFTVSAWKRSCMWVFRFSSEMNEPAQQLPLHCHSTLCRILHVHLQDGIHSIIQREYGHCATFRWKSRLVSPGSFVPYITPPCQWPICTLDVKVQQRQVSLCYDISNDKGGGQNKGALQEKQVRRKYKSVYVNIVSLSTLVFLTPCFSLGICIGRYKEAPVALLGFFPHLNTSTEKKLATYYWACTLLCAQVHEG